MHTYLLLRGIKSAHDAFIESLSNQFVSIKKCFLKKDRSDMVTQIQVRPITLWEIVYPKEHHDLVNRTIFGVGDEVKGVTRHKWHRPIVLMIRKALKLKKLDYVHTGKILPTIKADLELISLGTKEDRMEDGYEML